MSRRRAMLDEAQLPGEPLPQPNEDFTAAELQAWHDLVASCPDVLRASDASFVRACAQRLASCRRGLTHDVRDMYRTLGQLMMPMRERRRLLFPDRPHRRELS